MTIPPWDYWLAREDEAEDETDAGGDERSLARVAADSGFDVADLLFGFVLHVLDAGADLLGSEALHGIRKAGDVLTQGLNVVANVGGSRTGVGGGVGSTVG